MHLAQITDLHAGQPVEVEGRPFDTLAAAARAVAHVNGLDPLPEAVVITGDLVADETAENYWALAEVLSRLAMPAYLIPGNHDDRGLIRQVFRQLDYLPQDGVFLHYTVEDLPLRLIALDTQDTGQEGGLLCAERLDWLEARLVEAPERPTFILMHHPPFRTGIPNFDIIGLSGAEAFGEIVARYPNIQAIACGHVHRNITTTLHGALVAVTASTGYQYPLLFTDGDDFTKVREPAFCRLFRWNPSAGLISHLSPISP